MGIIMAFVRLPSTLEYSLFIGITDANTNTNKGYHAAKTQKRFEQKTLAHNTRRDGMFPSSQGSPESTDPFAVLWRVVRLQQAAANSGAERWILGTSPEYDIILPSTQPSPSPIPAAHEFTLDGNAVFRNAGHGIHVTLFSHAGEGTAMGGNWVLRPSDGDSLGIGKAVFVVEMAGARFAVVTPSAKSTRRGMRQGTSCVFSSRIANLQKTLSQVVASMLSGLSLNTSSMACD
ncbi:hypothetical protein MKZ38_007977 [Zalerion maritima]|uniref:Uncharacterized protein n=1 Tax=Zalerion maritima TaxID=339359 RepID=A0AAD5WNV1_9PEZI|nr:hypothetical protein MKZ38_007977 [Zalerion maritima]